MTGPPEDGDGSGLDPEIRRLVIEMMPQARSEAWKVFSSAPHALDLDELTSLAYTGLMAAAARWKTYCAERGFSPGCGQVPCADPASCGTRYFAAYSLRRIRGSMLDALRSQDWVTRSMRAKAKALRDAGQDLGASEAELAEQTNLTRKQIRDTLAGVAARPVSLDGLKSDGVPHDVPDSGDVEGQVVVSSILAQVLRAIDAMDAETQVILAFRFHQNLEFGAIAELLGTAEERVIDLHDAGVLAIHEVMLRAVTLDASITGMSLTPAELAAARGFRSAQRAIAERREPPDITVSVLVGNCRHDCPAQDGKSVFLELREHYVFSPELVIWHDPGAGHLAVFEVSPGLNPPAGCERIPAKRFGWIWTQGKCRVCGMTARSSSGRLVDPAIRPPAARALVSA